MGGIKVAQSVELNEDHIEWLKKMADDYGLPDEQKALRVVLDYVMEAAEETTLFTDVRCNHCD